MNMKQDYVAQEISDEYETRLCCRPRHEELMNKKWPIQ